MERLLAQGGRWLVAATAVAVVAVMITLRPTLDRRDDARNPASPAATTSVASNVEPREGVVEPEARPVGMRPSIPTPEPTPSPVPTPVRTVAPPPPIRSPVAAPPSNAGAGGPIGPLRTAPPGWVPPTSAPGDVIVEARVGQPASAAGITVSVTRLAGPTYGQTQCESGLAGEAGIPAGYEWAGYLATTTWSGFHLGWPGGSSPGALYNACYHGGHPFTSGATYEVWVAVPAGTGATAMLQLGYFPNDASPAAIFRFR